VADGYTGDPTRVVGPIGQTAALDPAACLAGMAQDQPK
jgi:hypothetical protein